MALALLPVTCRRAGRRLDFAVVPARAEHVTAMTAIYAEQIEDGIGSFEDPIPDVAEITRRLAAVEALALPALVALDPDGRVPGFCWARPFRPLGAYRGTVEGSIHVASDARHHGVGRALLEALLAACARQGLDEMIAVVGDARNRASIRLHQSVGFKPAGYLPRAGRKPDQTVDVVLLQRSLRPRVTQATN